MDTGKQYRITKKACYFTGVSTAITVNFTPLLFVSFREMYHLSYTLIGLLIAINFFTQLFIDLVFTFFTKHFNIRKTVKLTPFITFIGLVLFAVLPQIFPEQAFFWILVGTFIFAVASGLAEVLMSPVIAAIPSEHPDGEMSKLHSMYAWGVVGVVIISTLFIKVFGAENWMYLALFWSLVPLTSFLLFQKSELPPLENFGKGQKNGKILTKGILLCAFCIFLGGAAECTMSQWASGFIEKAIGIPKVMGDVLGVALFAVLLGIVRVWYSKYGKNIINFILYGMIGSALCYFAAGFILHPVVGLVACALTGICSSMLWPGTLIYVEEKFSGVGVAVYALMAAGGDMGASVAPQLVGIVSDKVSLTDFALSLGGLLGISAEQVGMRAGLLVAGLFPLVGIFLVLYMQRYLKSRDKKINECR